MFVCLAIGYGLLPLAHPAFDCSTILNPGTTEHRALQQGIKSDADAEFLETYAGVLKQNAAIVNLIPTENLIYILEQYRPSQISRLTNLLIAASEVVKNQSPGALPKKTFIAAMLEIDSPETTLILNFQLEIGRLKAQHKVAKAISDSAHGNQEYGKNIPYDYHLTQVRRVLKHFNYGPKNSILGLTLGTAARLHDILEDTNVSTAVLRQLFGNDIVSIVERVTNEPIHAQYTKETEPASEKHARKWRTYRRIAEDPRAVILKLADRIANTVESKYTLINRPGEKTAWDKYKYEWHNGLKDALGTPPGTEKMWAYLERLMTDDTFVPSPETFDDANN